MGTGQHRAWPLLRLHWVLGLCAGISSADCQVGLRLPRHILLGKDELPQPPSPSQLSLGWGISPILSVSGQGGHSCLFYPLTKARPARPAVSEFLWLGKPHFLFSRQAQRATQSLPACRGATALAPGQVKGTGVTQHWEEKAGGQSWKDRESSSPTDMLLLQHEACRIDL